MNPGQILEISGNYWQACTLHAGINLDVFTLIGHEQQTGKDIAQELNADNRSVTILLNALAAMGLLVKQGDTYSNTVASQSFLSKDSAKYIGYMLKHHHNLMSSWIQLDKGIKTGKPVRSSVNQQEEEERESFLMGMFNMAMSLAPALVREIDLSERSHLLDLGGGPGTYAIHFCLHNPDLKATVCDLPTTRPFAEMTIEKFGLTDRIDFKDVNYLEQDIPGRYDVAWLSHILHSQGPQECREIIQKTISSLKAGGKIIIHDFLLNNSMDGPLFPAIFSLNMLLGTEHGQSYSEQQVMDMLIEAQVKEVKRTPIQSPNDSGIILGRI